MLAGPVIHKTTDEQIELAVIVIVKPNGAGGKARGGQAGFSRHIGEGAVAIVLVQNAVSVGRDEDIRPAVVIVIGNRDAESECSAGDSGFFRDIGEGAIAIVLVEGVS